MACDVAWASMCELADAASSDSNSLDGYGSDTACVSCSVGCLADTSITIVVCE